MNYLVDTHIALWALMEPDRLSMTAKNILSDAKTIKFVSHASVWEIALKHCANPDRMPISSSAFADKCWQAGFTALPIGIESIMMTETLPYGDENTSGHKDPFDRLLICQAQSEGLSFVTHDTRLADYRISSMIFV